VVISYNFPNYHLLNLEIVTENICKFPYKEISSIVILTNYLNEYFCRGHSYLNEHPSSYLLGRSFEHLKRGVRLLYGKLFAKFQHCFLYLIIIFMFTLVNEEM